MLATVSLPGFGIHVLFESAKYYFLSRHLPTLNTGTFWLKLGGQHSEKKDMYNAPHLPI
jgi:hypothetical protein